ncbi:MAG: hypothetical protein CM15mV73_470 [Caudoviricetes sp.]|nr:MAG: hypothetical protein CM15mV73_470 [Caudoviricetes sp.]
MQRRNWRERQRWRVKRFQAVAQALGSGRLQGDEFRSICRTGSTILAPIAAELGVTIGELKKFASEGKIDK